MVAFCVIWVIFTWFSNFENVKLYDLQLKKVSQKMNVFFLYFQQCEQEIFFFVIDFRWSNYWTLKMVLKISISHLLSTKLAEKVWKLQNTTCYDQYVQSFAIAFDFFCRLVLQLFYAYEPNFIWFYDVSYLNASLK